ncbi:MAG: hypothetical protein J6C98_06355 [Oscillospiraceae bacterium]|nr:hypothetical protein [Oscillospiraceae bacterium]
MYFVTVNGKEYVTAHDKALVTFLRDELNMTGTKDAENADWVLVDGVKTSARAVRLSALKGKEIQTIEGFDDALVRSIAAHLTERGGIGSGFFAPGMAISAKDTPFCENAPETDSGTLEKVSGKRIFADDVNVPRQVYVRPVFAKNVGAKITKIDFSRALENVRFGDCIQKADIPGTFDGMIGVGDTVSNTEEVAALVVTTYLAEMNALCALINIEYDAACEHPARPVPAMPECATVLYSDDDTLTVYTNGDDPEQIRRDCAAALDIPADWITCVSSPVEGAKAGRAEVFAALVAWLTQQSAKVKF